MVGGLATLGPVPLRPRQRVDISSLVFWFAAYKVGIFALVTVNPRATRAIFVGALAIDLLLVFVLLSLTGGGESLFYLLFFPLVAVNAYYFGPWLGLGAAVVAGGLYAASAALVPPWVGWTPPLILVALVGLPAVTLGLVADRGRRGGAAHRRAPGPAPPPAGRPGGAARRGADGDGRAPLPQGRARGAQPDQRHRAERRDARGHRPRAGRGGHGRGQGARHGDPRPGQHARRPHGGVPRVRALPPTALRGGVDQRAGRGPGRLHPPRGAAPGAHAARLGGPRDAADGDRPRAPAPGRPEPRQERARGALERRAGGSPLAGPAPPAPGRGGRPACSSPSSRPSRRARASGSASPGRSPRSTAARSAGRAGRAAARRSRSGARSRGPG